MEDYAVSARSFFSGAQDVDVADACRIRDEAVRDLTERLEKWEVWFVTELAGLVKNFGVVLTEDRPGECMEAICDALLNLEGKLRTKFGQFDKKKETGE